MAEVLKEYLTKMLPINDQHLKVVAIGGTKDQQLGTDPDALLQTINDHPNIEEIFIFPDIGSSVLSAEVIVDTISTKKIYLSKGAFLENTYAAYVLANSGADFTTVVNACKESIDK